MALRLIALTVLSAAVPSLAGADWPHPRGPRLDGTIETKAPDADSVGLELSWRAPLGPAYSGIAISGGLAVTFFGDAEGSWVVGFDAATGREAWRSRLGAPYPGREGSTDGPLSSPAIGEGRVYALDPRGDLMALRLADGEALWRRNVKSELSAQGPDFGFTTTPLPAGDAVVVQIGGKDGKAIVALDGATGAMRWSLGDDKVEYQSPAVMQLAGRQQVVALGAAEIVGIDPADGERLWTFQFAEGDRTFSSSPTPIGEDRFVIRIPGALVAYRLSGDGEGGYDLEELYRSTELTSSYAPPVYHDGYIYGFRRQILTCIDAATGERVWRSRPPGGDGLILVDGRLVIFASGGHVVVADASPEGYRELARLKALKGSSLTWPSFAGGRVYVRNHEQIAAVAISSGESSDVVAGVDPPAAGHELDRWVARIHSAGDPEAVVEQLFAEHPRLPIVDGEFLHFLYEADAEDVAIVGSMLDTGVPEPMERIAGTDLFHRTFRLPVGIRWEYRFLVDYETWYPDPRNPLLVPIPGDEAMASEVATGKYETAAHLADPGASAGRIETLELGSKILGEPRGIEVWLPPGYDEGGADATYPLLVVNSGAAWRKDGLLANTLGNLVGDRIPPLVVALVTPSEEWWLEAGGRDTEDYVRMLAEELVPALEKRYRLSDERGVMGNQFWALTSALAGLRYPDIFDRVGVQSPFLGLGAGPALFELIGSGAGADSVRVYVDWNRYDFKNVDRGVDIVQEARTLSERLRDSGYEVVEREVLDSYGWSGWRNRSDLLLEALFGAGPDETPGPGS